MLCLVRLLETSKLQRSRRYPTDSLGKGKDSWLILDVVTAQRNPLWTNQWRDKCPSQKCQKTIKSGVMWWGLRSAYNSWHVNQKLPSQKWEHLVGYTCQGSCGKKHSLPKIYASKQQRWRKCQMRGWKHHQESAWFQLGCSAQGDRLPYCITESPEHSGWKRPLGRPSCYSHDNISQLGEKKLT